MSATWNVILVRPKQDVPWGLRLHGGVDCNEPVAIYQVRRHGLADKAGLKVGDFVVAIEGIPTNRLTHRQVLDVIGTERLSIKFTLTGQPQQQGGDLTTPQPSVSYNSTTSSLASRGLLAYLPVSATTVDATDITFPDADRLIDEGYYKPSYRAPPFRPDDTQQVKRYQPFDMTGKNSFYPPAPAAPPISPRHQQRPGYTASTNLNILVPYSSPAETARSYADYSPKPAVLKIPRRRLSDDNGQTGGQYWSSRISHYDNDSQLQQRSCTQSKSFLVLEAVLNEQGSGEKGLPPPPPHQSILEEKQPDDKRLELLAIHEPDK
jgi:hypothetical protein